MSVLPFALVERMPERWKVPEMTYALMKTTVPQPGNLTAMDDSERGYEDSGEVFLYGLPTPPQSHSGSPPLDGSLNVSVSTTFHPQALLHPLSPDVALVSSDDVTFYVHSHLLLRPSDNGFGALLLVPDLQVLHLNESSAVLNIVLCSVYDLPLAHFSLAFATLVAATNRLPMYGISPKYCITPSSSLFALLLSHGPQYPLELYALAASHDIYDLAVSASPHLLSFDLASLTDGMADLIGSFYLKRLFFLHVGRIDALKRILLSPPNPHPPTLECDFDEQKKLTRAWVLASAYIAWDARPDLTTSSMETTLQPLAQRLSCDRCQHALHERIQLLLTQWAAIKETI